MENKIESHIHDFAKDRWSIRRYLLTVRFLLKHVPRGTILDLGTENGLGNFMKEYGYKVTNTNGEDFDFQQNFLGDYICLDAITAFEIFEHLLNPFAVLRALPGNKLVCSVPLRLWFAPAFKNKTNKAGWHFHEFEQWQFFWLLEKAGWTVVDWEKHTSPTFTLGIRSIFRWFTPRFLFVYAIRK
jgi:hypothetical protein